MSKAVELYNVHTHSASFHTTEILAKEKVRRDRRLNPEWHDYYLSDAKGRIWRSFLTPKHVNKYGAKVPAIHWQDVTHKFATQGAA